MLNKEKRNPFIMIGKIYKYEAKNLCRMFIPLFALIILIGIVIGLTVPSLSFHNEDKIEKAINSYNEKQIDYDQLMSVAASELHFEDEEIDNGEALTKKREVTLVSAILLFYITCFATWILLVVFIDKRLKKGFIEDEAIFNFTLPVTIGEHIVGRFLCYLSFFIIWMIAIFCSSVLQLMKYISPLTIKIVAIALKETAVFGGIFKTSIGFILAVIFGAILLHILWISFLFFEKTISMIFSKKKFLMETIIELPIIVLWIYMMFKLSDLGYFTHWILSTINIILTVFFLSFTYFTYKKKINIE